jgi:hypothetical protein
LYPIFRRNAATFGNRPFGSITSYREYSVFSFFCQQQCYGNNKKTGARKDRSLESMCGACYSFYEGKFQKTAKTGKERGKKGGNSDFLFVKFDRNGD